MSPTIDGWICPPEHYNNGDGCHCSCGIADPDCEGDGVDLFCGGTQYDTSLFYCDDSSLCQPVLNVGNHGCIQGTMFNACLVGAYSSTDSVWWSSA